MSTGSKVRKSLTTNILRYLRVSKRHVVGRLKPTNQPRCGDGTRANSAGDSGAGTSLGSLTRQPSLRGKLQAHAQN